MSFICFFLLFFFTLSTKTKQGPQPPTKQFLFLCLCYLGHITAGPTDQTHAASQSRPPRDVLLLHVTRDTPLHVPHVPTHLSLSLSLPSPDALSRLFFVSVRLISPRASQIPTRPETRERSSRSRRARAGCPSKDLARPQPWPRSRTRRLPLPPPAAETASGAAPRPCSRRRRPGPRRPARTRGVGRRAVAASTGAGSAQSAAEGTSRTTGGEWAWRYRSCLAYCMYVWLRGADRSLLGALFVAVSGSCMMFTGHRCFWLGLAA